MGKRLNEVIRETGPGILDTPEVLCEKMTQTGYSERDILSVMLILKCCPSVSVLLKERCPDEIEADALVRAAVMKTGLNIMSARRALGILLHGCGYHVVLKPQLGIREWWIDRKMLLQLFPEENVDALWEKLQVDLENADSVRELHNRATAGDAAAAYAMGEHLRATDRIQKTRKGLMYYDLAARLGYAPANGAVADYLVRQEKPNFAAADARLAHPTALFGKDGRKWAPVTEIVLQYRKENLKRHRKTLTIQCVLMVLCVLLLACLSGQTGLWINAAAMLQVAGILWTVGVMLLRPCTSCTGAIALTMLSWLLMMFHI